jgi:3-hydroxy-3-methylglutaryl CoA synthase
VSYGFGAGADVTVLTVTENILRYDRRSATVNGQIDRRVLVDYATAAKYEGKYAKAEHALTAWT